MPTCKREKLTPVPKPRRERKPPQGGSGTAPPLIRKEEGPDLSHIAESLRPLAVPIGDLEFLAANPVKHPESQIETLKARLRQRGQLEPIIVNVTATPPVVISGNARLAAALQLGWQWIAVVKGKWTEAQANAIAIEMNRASEEREWDKAVLAELLKDVDTGNDPELDAMLAKLAEEEKLIPADPSTPTDPSQSGGGKKRATCPECGHEFTIGDASTTPPSTT